MKGAPDKSWSDGPAHFVTLSGYYIAETEVTVMGNNPSNFKDNANNPVESVSFNDCKEFIRKLNVLTNMEFRLPTEAEWEFAARGGNKSKGYKYAGSDNIDDVAWYKGNTGTRGPFDDDPGPRYDCDYEGFDYESWYASESGGHTFPVKTKAPNELGLYDMLGNVWEWCNDWYGPYSSDAQTDPHGPAYEDGDFHVIRGDSWSGECCSLTCRASSWNNIYTESVDEKSVTIGLRLALSE